MSTQMNTAEGIIKVYDHVTDKLGNMLPRPTWKYDSTIFSLKISFIIALVLLSIYAILIFIKKDKISGKEGKKKLIKYSNNGKIISEKISKEDNVKKSYCNKIFRDGILVQKVCYKKGRNFKKFVTPITIIISILIFILTSLIFFYIKETHYNYKLERTNKFHNLFIEFTHKLFGRTK